MASIVTVETAQEKTSVDKAAVDAAIAHHNTHEAAFLSFASSIQVTTLAEKIHNRLQPLSGEGVLRQYGKLVLVAHRHVNSSDSQRVFALYVFLAEYQALATWMKVEREIAVGGMCWI